MTSGVTQRWVLAALLAGAGGCTAEGGGDHPADARAPDAADAMADGVDAMRSADAMADGGAMPDGDTMPDAVDAMPDPGDAQPDAALPVSPGCGAAPMHALGGVQTSADFGPTAGGERSFFLSLPPDYDPTAPHPLIIAYAGTNWTGAMIRPYFGFERAGSPGEIFVYPDLRWRDFGPWGELGGWLLGPHAAPADGMEDIEFTRALIDHLA